MNDAIRNELKTDKQLVDEARRELEKRRESDERICSFKGFGKTEPHRCNCTGEEIQECRENYDKIKKEQYVDSKGQHSFTDNG